MIYPTKLCNLYKKTEKILTEKEINKNRVEKLKDKNDLIHGRNILFFDVL